MIEVESVSKSYGREAAVRGLSFKVESGAVHGFLGPNGAGKTTTMRILTTFLRADEGLVRVAGFDVGKNPEEVRRRIGYMPESPPLYRDLSVEEYLKYMGQLRISDKVRLRQRLGEVIEDCLLGDVRTKLCSALSKGYRQRVGLAQAVLHEPEVLILDEPTSGLDPQQIIQIRRLIRSMAGKRTVLISTHILTEVEEVCDTAVIIARGRKVDEVNVAAARGLLEQIFLQAVTRSDESAGDHR